MGQIVNRGNVKAVVNLQAIQTVAQNSNLTQDGSKASTVLANGEIWLIDTTNSKSGNGDGKYDSYIVGNGSSVASALTILEINEKIVVDNSVTQGSTNAVSGGAVYSAILAIDVSSQISGKADKSEMSVVPGTGANADKTTITLKSGTSATVLTQHQDISGKQDTISNVTVAVDANIGTPAGTASFNNNTLAFSFQNIKGEKGDTGAQGIQGVQGERGPKGDTGITGDVSALNIVHGIEPKVFYEETQVAGADAVQELYLDKYTYLDLKNVSGWKNGNAVNLIAGHTYKVTITNSGNKVLTYFRVYDGENNNSQPLGIPSDRVTGVFTTEYTPEVDIVKVDFFSQSVGRCVITEANANKVLLTHDDVVNNLNEGGTDVPLSAEQGKELNKDVSIFNKYTVPLSHGAINGTRYSTFALTNAKGIIKNNGFSTLEVKNGYEYIIYGSDSAIFGTGSTTTIVGTYTSEPYVNESTLQYLWICVKRTDDSNIPIEDLTNIVILTDKTSAYNFKTINDVCDYYKYAKEIDITDYEYISGEGCDINSGTNTAASYERTAAFKVTNYDALKIYYDSDYDGSHFGRRITVCWFDDSNNVVGTTQIILETKDRIAIIGVPHHAKYASVDTRNRRFKIYGLKHEKTAADAHYYNTSKCEIGKLEDVTLILCCGQSLMGGADAPGISYEETYFPLRKLGYINNEIRYFARLVNPKGSLGFEKPDRGIGEMFVEAIAKENGISVYANEWERHLLVFVNTSRGGLTIAQLTDDTEYVKVTNAITNTKTLCDKFGLTMAAPAWVWMQGEQDIKAAMSSAAYKTALLAYQDKICNSLSTIAGITKRPKCCIYQPGSQCLYSQTYNFVNPYLEFNNAYVELLRDNDEFIACAPVYIFDGADNTGGFVHLNARSYKTLGAYAGYSIKKALIDGVKVKGVIPIDVTVDGTTINIKYNVPCPPLKFDTEWVKEPPLTNGVHNYGFNVVKSDDTELITNVSVFDDTVTIECSESPIGAKLRYGLNGDRIHMTNSEYWGIDGRIHGGRGNLRDSQGDYVQKEIRELGQTMRLDNWAYCFEELLTEPEGE